MKVEYYDQFKKKKTLIQYYDNFFYKMIIIDIRNALQLQKAKYHILLWPLCFILWI